MKQSRFAIAAVAVLAMGAARPAKAVLIPAGSELSLSGDAIIGGTQANPTVDFTLGNNAMNNTGAFLTVLGNAGTVVLINEGTTISVSSWPTTIAINPTCAGGQTGCLYDVTSGANTASFNLTSVTFTDNGSFLDVTGTGIVQLTGFDPTPATFLLSSQATGDTTFSATTTAVPGPTVGVGLPGLIAALGGLVAMARRRRKLA